VIYDEKGAPIAFAGFHSCGQGGFVYVKEEYRNTRISDRLMARIFFPTTPLNFHVLFG
jgi:hypothetical protein